jgi:hypothetical protein
MMNYKTGKEVTKARSITSIPQFERGKQETIPKIQVHLKTQKFQNVCTHMIIISHILSATEKDFTEKKYDHLTSYTSKPTTACVR